MFRFPLKKTIILLGLVIVIIVMGMHLSAGNSEELTLSEFAARTVLSPVQQLFTGISGLVSDVVALPVRLYNVDQQNQQLAAQVADLEEKLAEHNEIKGENERLKAQLNFKNGLGEDFKMESAEVIAREADNWFALATINKGSANGIKQDMAVVTPAGLVGRITNVTKHTAEVLLITDPRSGVGCLVQESRAPGIVEGVIGGRGIVNMVHIASDEAPSEGEQVVTSGYGSVFPKGIPVGTVLEANKEESGMFFTAVLQTAVDFNRLEEVMVIIS